MRVPASYFLHDRLQKTLTAEASTLDGNLGRNWFNGITLVTKRGTTANFFLKERHDDPEGDVTHWVFTCSTNPKADGYRMVIFND